MIKLVAGQEAHAGWLFCKGQVLDRKSHKELARMIGNRFGGGPQEVGLPDLPTPEVGEYVIKVVADKKDRKFRGLISQVWLFLGQDQPAGWMFCDGRVLAADKYPVLARTMGSNYGGDGVTTVGLPNMAAAPGINYIICVDGVDPTGEEHGEVDDDDY